MRNGIDIAVLGAGVAGCATAYFLAKEGASVAVVEREAIGSCASGYALGLLNPLTGTGIPGPAQPLAEAAFKLHRQLWPALQEESGVDIQARLMPHLELCLTAEAVAFYQKEVRRWSEAEGFSARWLGPDEALRLEPRLAPDLLGAVLLESVGMLDSYRYTLALAQAAERHGARFLNGQLAGVKRSGDRVTSVLLGSQELACGAVVLALGPWSGHASRWLGLDIPVRPLKGQILHLQGTAPPLEYHLHGPCSLVHKADGMVWVGATEEEAGFDTTVTAEARDALMERAVRTVPCLAQQALVRQTACLRPVTPDRQPIIGKAPGWENVYLATGAEKKGILISPAIGRSVADLVLRGETSLPIAPFAPGRPAPAR